MSFWVNFPKRNFRGIFHRGRSLSTCHSLSKDVSGPFPQVYKSEDVERGWYEWWEKRKHFTSTPNRGNGSPRETYSMILPPPNITGTLHLGHALTCVIEDALCRWQRMKGKNVVWVPGSDHAGIATQMVVEKVLAKEGSTRQSLGREKFLQEIEKWRQEKGMKIFEQLKLMGASLNWERTCFTKSESHNRAVNEAFKILFERGLIYRDKTLINWSTTLQSVISDIEVDHMSLEKKTKISVPGYEKPIEFGVMYEVSYEIEGSEDSIHVSTTRPETMLGDVAIAVNPDDKRYSGLVGKSVKHPFISGELIPIIGDEYVKPDFGTGALKITPGHDHNDFVIAKRHNLPFKSVIDDNGRIFLPDLEQFHGLPRFDARWAVVKHLKSIGQFHGSQSHAMQVPICSRSGDIVEPHVKTQWFLKCSEMASRAVKASESNEIKFYPNLHQKTWINWMSNMRDWCISRQIWWGHRIPLFNCSHGQQKVWLYADSSEEAKDKAIKHFQCSDKDDTLEIRQEEDVLDTWFSSALLPFANFGWPQQVENFFPLNLMETGHDIMFFWVAKMVMMSQELTGQLPFEKVLFHGIVCDAHGRKMSKSLGNVIDPVDVIDGITLEKLIENIKISHAKGQISNLEVQKAIKGLERDFPDGIAGCGADPLRFGLASYDIKSMFMNLDIVLMKKAGAFCNKIWQASRYLLQSHNNIVSKQINYNDFDCQKLMASNAWILSRCAVTVHEVNEHLNNYDFHLATRTLRQYLYTNLCDVYLESTKPVLCDESHPNFAETLSTLQITLITGLKLLHPFMPFITEELFHRLPVLQDEVRQETILYEDFPAPDQWSKYLNPRLNSDVEFVLVMITAVRKIKDMYHMARSTKPDITIVMEEGHERFQELTSLIQILTPSGQVCIQTDSQFTRKPTQAITVLQGEVRVYVDFEGLVNAEAALGRFNEKVLKLTQERNKLMNKLSKLKVIPESREEKLKLLDENLENFNEQLVFLQNSVDKS